MFSLPNCNQNIWCDGAYFKLLEIAETRAMGTSSFDCNEYKECLLFSKKIQRMSSQSANYPAGEKLDLDDIYIGCVDVRDVAHSLLVLYENPSAQGRHLCLESIEHLVDFTNNIADLYPEHRVQRWYVSKNIFLIHLPDKFSPPFANVFFHIRIREDKQCWVVRAKDPSKKLIGLGVRFTPFDKTIRDTVGCFRSKGHI